MTAPEVTSHEDILSWHRNSLHISHVAITNIARFSGMAFEFDLAAEETTPSLQFRSFRLPSSLTQGKGIRLSMELQEKHMGCPGFADLENSLTSFEEA